MTLKILSAAIWISKTTHSLRMQMPRQMLVKRPAMLLAEPHRPRCAPYSMPAGKLSPCRVCQPYPDKRPVRVVRQSPLRRLP